MIRFFILSFSLFFSSLPAVAQELFPYRVKKEDTLLELCDIFKISKEELLKHNPSHKLDRFWAGDEIKIPLTGLLIRSYKVKRGDSLFDLIAKHQVDVEALYLINDKLRLERLWAGDTLLLPIPLKKKSLTPPKKQAPGNKKYLQYKVKNGDSFYQLSRRFNIPLAELEALNPHSILLSGTVLKIPQNLLEESLLRAPLSAPEVSLDLNLPGIHYLPSSRENVTAPQTGTVSGIRHIKGYGRAIFIQSKNITVILASKGFDSLLVSYGSKIKAGMPLGVIREKFHLHLFVLRDGEFVFPKTFMSINLH